MRASTERVDWKLDANNDLVIPIRYTTGVEAAAQGIRIRIGMIRGEWFRNRDKGVRWLDNDFIPENEAILGQTFDELKARAEIRNAILDTEVDDLVIESLQVAFDPTNRRLGISWRVRVQFTDLNESITGSIVREL